MNDTPVVGESPNKVGTLNSLRSTDDHGRSYLFRLPLSRRLLTPLLYVVSSPPGPTTGLDDYRSNLKRVSHAHGKRNQSGMLLYIRVVTWNLILSPVASAVATPSTITPFGPPLRARSAPESSVNHNPSSPEGPSGSDNGTAYRLV